MRRVHLGKNKILNQRRLAKRNYYQSKKRGKRYFLYLVLFSFLALFSFYFLVYSSYCKINNLSIEVEDYPSLRYLSYELELEVQQFKNEKYLFFIPKDSLVFFPIKKIEKFLEKDERIENFEIKKRAPDTLEVKLKVFEPSALFLAFNQKNYLINKNGEKIIETNDLSYSLPVIEDMIGQKNNFSFLVRFIKEINKNFDFEISKIEIYHDKGIEMTKAITSENWDIYFDEAGDLEEQIANLFLVTKEKIEDRQNLSYIDLRFGNKIFYK